MRILYLSQYFPPEAGATQTRAYELACNFVRLGHHVTMIAEVPNHPSGIIPPHYRGKLWERSTLDGIDVIRVWVKASPVKNFRSRLLFYLSFMLNAFAAGMLLAHGRFDLIYASSPPLFVGGSALALSYLRRIPLVFEVRDLWPGLAVALGELSNPRAIALATHLEEACYRRAKRIVTVTRGDLEILKGRGIPEGKLLLVPNGANVDLFRYMPEERSRLREKLNIQGKFTAVYAGLFGIAQGLEVITEAAGLLLDDPGYHFLLVGGGPNRAAIEEEVRAKELSNVTLLPEQPRESIPRYLSAADAAIIPLRNNPQFAGTIPSKLFDAWACERPVVITVDGEARRLVEEAEGGIFVPPEDPQGLVSALRKLREDPALGTRMGAQGKSLTVRRYTRRALAEMLERELVALIQPEIN